jgi:hypothetical protein
VRDPSRPRIGNGVRRGLALLAVLGQGALHDSASWKSLRVIERREFCRALAWVEWHRTHNRKGVALELAPWPAKRLGRRQRAKLEQIPIPFEACQDAEGAD